uniref:Uncharacterized protein n=1 Tax=Ciona savignyi TaxID=51511 RepID=H2YI56_CIOSA
MLFQNAIRNSKLRKFIEVPAQKVAVHSSLESYALHGIYTVNMRELNDIMSRQDQYLNKITRNLASIKFSDLEINEEFCSTIPRARRELSLLNRYRTP